MRLPQHNLCQVWVNSSLMPATTALSLAGHGSWCRFPSQFLTRFAKSQHLFDMGHAGTICKFNSKVLSKKYEKNQIMRSVKPNNPKKIK
jgi:hypothetical protein